jgi:proprotein convertase subtilisin/kexin type 5
VNGIAYFLNSNACTVSCPIGQFGNINNMQCTTCATGCATCFGSAVSECTSCKLATNNYYLIYGTTYCSQTCPDGQYANATSFSCLLCASSCKTCTTSSTNCVTCGFSQLGTDLFFYSNQCLLTCPYGYFPNVGTHTCDQCTDGCAACYSSGLTSCTVCKTTAASIIHYKFIGADTCGTVCPDGQFISAAIPHVCQKCSSVCVTCSSYA